MRFKDFFLEFLVLIKMIIFNLEIIICYVLLGILYIYYLIFIIIV